MRLEEGARRRWRVSRTLRDASPNFPLSVFWKISTPARRGEARRRERIWLAAAAAGSIGRAGCGLFLKLNPPSRSPLSLSSTHSHSFGFIKIQRCRPPSSGGESTRGVVVVALFVAF